MVTVGLSIAAHLALLPPRLRPFRARYPDISLHIIEGFHPTLEERLRDGTVEVVAGGSAEAVDALEAWLQHGPEGARVDATRRERWVGEVPKGFLTR